MSLEPVLKSGKLSQSAVDLSIHSEPQRRAGVGGSQPIGIGDQAPDKSGCKLLPLT